MLKKAWRAYGLCERRKEDGVQKKKGLGTDYKGLISRRDTRQPSSKDAVTEPHLASTEKEAIKWLGETGQWSPHMLRRAAMHQDWSAAGSWVKAYRTSGLWGLKKNDNSS